MPIGEKSLNDENGDGPVKIVDIRGSTGNSILRIGEGLKNLEKYIPLDRTVIITDPNVMRYHGKDFPDCRIIEIGTGEKVKNLDTVRDIYEKLVEIEVDRSWFIIGIGGGIVCDITGFAASTYMRGIRFGFVSSTLLSQVDASVGGKNGVNFRGYKNLVGLFNQPEFVLCDLNLLKSLPEKEILCGLAEVVKHGAIASAELFTYLEQNTEKVLSLNDETMEKIVLDSVNIKSSIVNRDEKEQGERRKLNFGHTFGHAIEKTTELPHGYAVSIGMTVASRLSVKKGKLPSEEGRRIEELLRKLNLPVDLPFDRDGLLDAMGKDKKRRGDSIDFVLLNRIGTADVEPVSMEELERVVME